MHEDRMKPAGDRSFTGVSAFVSFGDKMNPKKQSQVVSKWQKGIRPVSNLCHLSQRFTAKQGSTRTEVNLENIC